MLSRDASLLAIGVVSLLAICAVLSWWIGRLSAAIPARADVRSSRRMAGASSLLEMSIAQAVDLNTYLAHPDDGLAMSLRGLRRCRPRTLLRGADDVRRLFRDGHVVSVDLGDLGRSDAARLVDFCSGLVGSGGGWIFRAGLDVIVLAP